MSRVDLKYWIFFSHCNWILNNARYVLLLVYRSNNWGAKNSIVKINLLNICHTVSICVCVCVHGNADGYQWLLINNARFEEMRNEKWKMCAMINIDITIFFILKWDSWFYVAEAISCEKCCKKFYISFKFMNFSTLINL